MKAGLDAAAAARYDEGSPYSLSVTLWRELRKIIGCCLFRKKGFSSTFETRSRTLGPGPFEPLLSIVCVHPGITKMRRRHCLYNNPKCFLSLSFLLHYPAKCPAINKPPPPPHYCLFRMLLGQEIAENEEFLLFLLILRYFEIFFPPTSACIFTSSA